MTANEQYARIFKPRKTNWPEIYIQLDFIERKGDTIKIYWKYLNKTKNERFIWGLNQPNFVSHTQIFDYDTGKYHNVSRIFKGGAVQYLCSSTNKDDNSGWSKAIPAGGELNAEATFKNVKGKNIQILYHSAMPLFYKPDNSTFEKPKLTN